MNYKLKDIARHLLNLQAREFPGQVNRLHLDDLVAYLKSDLLVTRELYDQLQGQLDFTDRVYNNQLIAPITPLLVRMAVAGVQADPNFVREETQRLLNLTECMSEMHDQRFSISLDAGDFRLRGWLYFDRNGLRCKKIPTGKKRLPSLRTKDLKTLYQQAGRDARESLALIHDYNMTRSLMIRLRSLEQHIDRESHRIHSNFNDFRQSRGDFYTFVATRMLDQDLDDGKREQVKRTSLGIVNGMSAKGLAKQLDEDESVARNYLEAFAMTYPQVITFSDLTKHIFAATGEALTFGGRRRRISPHWWMVNKPVVELFISYKDNDKLWLRVVPLRPNRFTLTCWVLRVIDAKYGSPNEGQEIYNHRVGRISQAPYKFFNDSHLVFRLSVDCKRGLRIDDTVWTLNVHHEKAEEGLLPDGSQGVCIQVIDAWEILCVCEDCMKKHVGSWMQRQASGPKWFDDEPQILDTTNGEL